MAKTTKIVLTGGPCAGKTTALARIVEHFTGIGLKVFVLPELATLFSQAGVNFLTSNKQFFYNAEKQLLKFQIEMENSFVEMAKHSDKPAIIITDRGTMDIAAYLVAETWQTLLDDMQIGVVNLRDARYDAVLHMVTAADGAEKFYSNENNKHRTETIEQAREIDQKLIRAWTGHPHLRVIGNNGDFEQKILQVLKEISDVLGVPEPIEMERKYLVEIIDNIPDAVESEIFQTYLITDNNTEERVRKRGSNGNFIYFHTIKKTISDLERIETEEIISPNRYIELLDRADKSRSTIHKIRKSFIWNKQYFELDTFISPDNKLTILEIEGVAEHEDIQFPSFLRVLEDITGNLEYYNYNLSMK